MNKEEMRGAEALANTADRFLVDENGENPVKIPSPPDPKLCADGKPHEETKADVPYLICSGVSVHIDNVMVRLHLCAKCGLIYGERDEWPDLSTRTDPGDSRPQAL